MRFSLENKEGFYLKNKQAMWICMLGKIYVQKYISIFNDFAVLFYY